MNMNVVSDNILKEAEISTETGRFRQTKLLIWLEFLSPHYGNLQVLSLRKNIN